MGKQIAMTILNQLGGNKFMAMTGAKNLSYDENGTLNFKLPKFTGVKINHVKIELNGNDLYNVTFGRIYGLKYKILNEIKDVYNDQLQEIFTKYTGLDTHL